MFGADTFTGALTRATGQNVNTYAINQGTLNNSNYAITYVPASFVITPARLMLTGSREYDGTNLINGSAMQVNGVNGERFTASGSANLTTKNVVFDSNNLITTQALLEVGGLTLTGNSGALLSNYSPLTSADTRITLSKRALALTAPSISKVYDSSSSYNMTAADLAAMSNLLVGSDTVTAATVVFAGNNANVGVNKAVNLLSATINDGNNGLNYNTSLSASSTSEITPASLTVTAGNWAKFVTQAEPSSYGGAIYNGFVGNESIANLSGALTISRSNPTAQAANTYTLTPGGFGAAGSVNGNYRISYQPGNFIIVPANQLLVEVSPVSVTYGAPITYSATAKYLNCSMADCSAAGSVNTVTNLTPVITGSNVVIADGVGGSASFTIAPIATPRSGSGMYAVGGYNLNSVSPTITGANFNSMALTGSLTINRLVLSTTQLGISGAQKVYDGNAAIAGLSLPFSSAASAILNGDQVLIGGSGYFDNQNVGINKAVTLNIDLSGSDANNYRLSSNQFTDNTGIITQLASVTYVGASGGNWSNASNWAGGAIPTLSNVANVVIPTGTNVNYDNASLANQIPTSSITNNGVIAFTGANNFTFTNTVTGSGSISQSGAGALTITGSNSYSGGTSIDASRLIVGSSSALGTGSVSSNGGTLSIASGVTLPSLTVNGPVRLTGDISTTGNQTYNGAVTLVGSGAWTPTLWDVLNSPVQLTTNLIRPSGIGQTLTSNSANIAFNSTLLAANHQSLSINASSGTVTFGDSVGNSSQIKGGSQNPLYATYDKSQNINHLLVNASRILIKANIATIGDQMLKGTILIGDNGQNGLTRTLLSADPSIQLIGTVDDAGNSNHKLILYVISAPGGAVPTLNIGGPVGSSVPLASLAWIVGTQNLTSFVADISAGTTPVNSITKPYSIITAEIINADNAAKAAAAAASASAAAAAKAAADNAANASRSRNALPFQAMMQQAIFNMGSISSSNQSGVSVSMPQDVAIVRSSGPSINAGTQISESKSTSSQASANANATLAQPLIAAAEPSPARQIMVQIQTAQGVEQVPRSQVSSDSGLSFKVPTAVLATLQVSPTASNVGDAKAPVLFATLADGSALPSWIQFDPVTKTFSATQIPSDVKSVTIKLQSKQGQEIIGESVMTLSAN